MATGATPAAGPNSRDSINRSIPAPAPTTSARCSATTSAAGSRTSAGRSSPAISRRITSSSAECWRCWPSWGRIPPTCRPTRRSRARSSRPAGTRRRRTSSRRGRTLAWTAALLAVPTAVVFGIVSRDRIAEEWYLWRLESARDVAGRALAVRKLGGIGGRRSLEPLLRLVREDPTLGAEAVAALSQRKAGPTAGGLLGALRFRDADFRAAADSQIFTRAVEDQEWVPAIVELALRDPSSKVRDRAVAGLRRIGRPAVPLLVAGLSDRREIVLEDDKPLEPADAIEGGSSEPIAEQAIKALQALGPDAADA